MTRVLITGANGLLGQKLVKQCQLQEIDFLATSKGKNRNTDCPNSHYQELDILNKDEIDSVFDSYSPTHVINTAAITNVDSCEAEPDVCEKVNVHAVKLMFTVCKKRKIHFQQLSTDFVFPGEKSNYSEEDKVKPLSTYAASKVKSEQLLQEDDYTNWSIVRTIIVYGTAYNLSRSNIVLWARSELKKGNTLNIVDDQFRSPTWAEDLAKGCLSIVLKKERGLFHISGKENYSMYELVQKMADFYNVDSSLVRPIKSDQLGRPAPRPPKTGFDLSKAFKRINYAPLTFIESLEELEKELLSQ